MFIGFLHTAGVHAATFESLLRQADPLMSAVHLVDQSLLDEARASDDAAHLQIRVATALRALATLGAERIVCTCSTIGGIAETVGIEVGLSVIRVDRPMAQRAVALNGAVLVVATLESTMEPTLALINDEACRASAALEIHHIIVEGAWVSFEAGDIDSYHDRIETAVRLACEAGGVDLVVLAQASMAGAVGRLHDLGIPILASPACAIEYVLEH